MITYNIRHLQHCDKSTNERINFLRKMFLYHFLKVITFFTTFYLTHISKKCQFHVKKVWRLKNLKIIIIGEPKNKRYEKNRNRKSKKNNKKNILKIRNK